MIGVLYTPRDEWIVREFFELFKTPWEPYASDVEYDVLLVTSGDIPHESSAKVIIVYGASIRDRDVQRVPRQPGADCIWLQRDDFELPIYGDVATFPPLNDCFLRAKVGGESVGEVFQAKDQHIIRIGYDLFDEVAILLTKGQPASNATTATLELHISILRDCLIRMGVPFIEIPPAAYGFDFAASATHDVDFVGIRDHKFDHTMLGFVYRASIGALVSLAKGRSTWKRCIQNWKALASLPFVYLGICEDFWIEFDRYCEIERGLNPTYFFIPFRDEPGTWNGQPAPPHRAAKYDVREIGDWIGKLTNEGCEIGLHGLNAWRDADSARKEKSRLSEVVDESQIGVRMHWLYSDEESPKALRDADLIYDSTCGYNDGIGFRAGTAQGFCPPNAPGFLELPLVIQDTAMFYPDRMNLSEVEARNRCDEIIQSMIEYGGTLTINWHTRSLSPERLWGDFYKELLECIKRSRVWFCNCRTNAAWFRARRAVRFETARNEQAVRLTMDDPVSAELPPLRVRVYGNGKADHLLPAHDPDIPWRGEAELSVSLALNTSC